MWFSVPFTLSTSLGLACVALDLPVTIDEANMGLVPVAAAQVRPEVSVPESINVEFCSAPVGVPQISASCLCSIVQKDRCQAP